MNYHTPDPTWEALGCPDYDSYENQYVIKGKFNEHVPEDVLNSYKVAEYIMAHSFYYYTMYDEASAKLLRVLEMAIKIRCKQLGIPVRKSRSLSKLIDEMTEYEPLKYLGSTLQAARELRNLLIHRDQFEFSGFINKPVIIKTMDVLNQLFLPPDQKIASEKSPI